MRRLLDEQKLGLTNPVKIVDQAGAEAFGRANPAQGAVAFVVNTDRFFLTHRVAWALSMRASGADVVVIAKDTGYGPQIRQLGLVFVDMDLGRETKRAHDGVVVALRLGRVLARFSPRVVFLVATAAYTLGTWAAFSHRSARFVVVVTGAGRALSGSGVASSIVGLALRAQRCLPNVRTLFQLESDRRRFVESGLVNEASAKVVPGTGIDCTKWTAPDRSTENQVVVLFSARLFLEKGPRDFAEVARMLRDSGARFVMAGQIDEGVASALPKEELESWQEEGILEYVGVCNDMPSLLRAADILVAPSVHPEGTPRAIIEAAASGLAIVAYRQPGVDFVLDQGNAGVLVERSDVRALCRAVERLIVERRRREDIGRAAQKFASRNLGLDKTLASIYDLAFG